MASFGAGQESQPLIEDDGAAGTSGRWMVVLVYCGIGLVLVGTYVWGVVTLINEYGTPVGLWGHIADPGNEWLLHTYYTSIGLATVGFFPALAHMLKAAPVLPKNTVIRICGLLAGFYVTELFWMPMCVAYIEKPSLLVYMLIRLQLACSGLLAVAWAVTVCTIPSSCAETTGSTLKLAGFVGTAYFAFHCAVLDAVVWPPMFYRA
eukprot:gb/GFBE01013698.1/.p1 GENE.gb/GFBE01013698.1/~~gb/GFBE01013698.1/.p1  ORF type:complete len:206 (+),score=37.71 gb/GFBE01013698.1/:1-618(+)